MPPPRRRFMQALAQGATLAAAAVLAGCGFKPRAAPDFAFRSIRIAAPVGSPLALELRRQLNAGGRVQALAAQDAGEPEVTLELLREQREKVVAGVNASGQVREFTLRLRLQFRLRARDGRELVEPTELLQQRDMSFSETVALAKEAEEALLYRDMQGDLVQQLLRRLAALRVL